MMSNPFQPNPFGGGPVPPRQQVPASPVRDEVNVLATLSVVFAFVFAPAGALFGHLGLAQIRRTGEKGRERALIGTTLSYVFITAAVVALIVASTLPRPTPRRLTAPPATSTPTTTTTTTTTTPPPPPPTVAPADLDALLPSLDDVEDITGDRTMKVKRTLRQPTADEPRGQLDRQECWPAEESSSPEAYDGSGFTGFLAQEAVDTHDASQQWTTGAGVAAYGNAPEAQAQLAKMQASFRQCGGSTIKATWPSGGTWPMSFAPPADSGNGITAVAMRAETPIPISCTHGIAAKLNVVVDVEACTSTPTADPSQRAVVAIINLIVAKIRG